MRLRIFVLVAVATLLAGPALADWVPEDGHKMHYPQLPDLDNGMNVLATGFTKWGSKLLADDWQCSERGPVLDIHIWGSYWEDIMPPDPTELEFDLYIFDDIPDPDGSGPEYSMPGPMLWSYHYVGPQVGQVISSDEPFYDPNTNEVIGYDTKVVQYNFDIPLDNAFWQEQGNIYWLGVQKTTTPFDNTVFGWKTSADHWNDDAVFLDYEYDPGGPIGEWAELRAPWTDPSGQLHPSLDLSFVITPEPTTVTLLLLGAGALGVLRRRRMH